MDTGADQSHQALITARLRRERAWREATRRTISRLLAVTILSIGVIGATSLVQAAAAPIAAANTWHADLGSPSIGIIGGGAEPAGTTYGPVYTYNAPAGTVFDAFGYTAANFGSDTADSSGGMAVGFVMSGGPDGSTPLLDHWTDDCSITNGGHLWTYDGQPAEYTGGQADCYTTGNTSGWAYYTNTETNSTSPSTPVASPYSTLHFEMWCQAARCSAQDAASGSATNLSAQFADPQSQPVSSLLYVASGTSGVWYQTDGHPVSLAFNSLDPGGTCYLNAELTGPQTVNSGDLVSAPATVDVGGFIGTEFDTGTNQACNAAENYTWTLPAGIASGSYTASVQAANPGNYEAQGFSGVGSPTTETTADLVDVDNETPTLAVAPTGDGSTGTVNVTVGPSGIGSVSCTQAGTAVTLHPEAGNPSSGAGTYSYDVETNTSGLACQASNGDANGALIGTVDTPSVQIDPPGYTQGTWTSKPVLIAPLVSQVGTDGTTGFQCTVNGVRVGNPDSFVVTANGISRIECTVQDQMYSGVVGSVAFTVDEDAQVPLVSFDAGSGYAATSAQAVNPSTANGQNWLNGADPITIGVTATESQVMSGISQTTCLINGYAQGEVLLSNTGGATSTPFDDSFTLTKAEGGIDGQNVIVCQSRTGGSVTGADGTSPDSRTTEYVDVDDASWPAVPGTQGSHITGGNCGISSAIDNGSCAYSDGPSQTQWQRTAQTVRITADDTANNDRGAPITKIVCSGVPMPVSSWTAATDPQDVDQNNGMSVIATVEPQGGTLSCSASDAAVPANTWQLGTYVFPIDSISPTGWFEPQGYRHAPRDMIQIHTTDGGSGVARVVVDAVDIETGQTYGGQQLTGRTADGNTANATYDLATGLYDLTVDPAMLPAADSFAFRATVTDVAGNGATVTTIDRVGGGGRFVLAPGGGGPGSLGDLTTMGVAATAARQLERSATLPAMPSFVTGIIGPSPLVNGDRTVTAVVASVGARACYRSRVRMHTLRAMRRALRRRSGQGRVTCQSRPARPTRITRVRALTIPYGGSVAVTGKLTDTTAHVPIRGARIGVYATNAATGVVTVLGYATTGASGAFRYAVAPGPSRTITLAYAGSGSQRGTAAAFDTRTVGKAVLRARINRVRPGARIRLAGRVVGGNIPDHGALIQLMYAMPGHMLGWRPFTRTQSNRRGRYEFVAPVPLGDGGYVFRLRVQIPTQTGWGYRATTSNTVTVRVQASGVGRDSRRKAGIGSDRRAA